MIILGSYYCEPATASLQDKFRDILDITTTQFSLFFSINSWSSVFLCVFSGILIDKVFGIRLGTIIFILILTFGQILFASGATINVYWLMMLGKFLYGAGDETLNVALTKFPVIWFKKQQLNMVFGIQIAVSRFSSTVSYWTMEPIYERIKNHVEIEHTVGMTLFVTSILCMFSTICALILGLVDRRAEKVLNRKSEIDQDAGLMLRSFKLNFWILCIICLSFYSGFLTFVALAK